MSTPRDPAAIPAELMSLPAASFVRAAIETLGATAVTPRDANALTQSIMRGVNKSKIWAAIQARAIGVPAAAPPTVPTALVRPDDDIATEEVLIGHAPDDDTIFVDYAAYRLIGRDLQMHERLALRNRLNSGSSRSDVLREIIDMARAEGRNPTVARIMGDTPFSLVSAERRERLVLMLSLGERGLMVADGGLTENAVYQAGGLSLESGLVFAGPKKSLRAGRWRLNVNWDQHPDSAICFEATVNGGLEKLFSMTFAGQASFASEFTTLPEHLVFELLIFAIRKGEADDAAWIVKPQEVSLTWIAE